MKEARAGIELSQAGQDSSPAPSRLAPKITDFGLARPMEGGTTLTHSGFLVGTPGYMAPEQADGQRAKVGPATDVYAVGVILYQLLTGRLPFQGDSTLEVLRAVTSQEPVRPRRLRPRIPRDLEAITLHCLEKVPARRYPSAADLGADLRRWLAGQPILARRVSAPERLGRWCKRNQAVAVLLAAVFLLLATVAGVASVGYLQTRLALNREAHQRAAAEQAEARAMRDASRAGAAEQEMRRQWYAASSNLMQPAWDTGQVGRLRALLAETEAYPDRGFEWYYWQRLCHLDQHTFIGHRSELLSVSWSPDGRRLATGSYDGTARVWDAAGGQEVLALRGHSGLVYSVSWSPDGRRLATGGEDGSAKVWDAAGGPERLTLRGHAGLVYEVSWSPDGTRLATGSSDAMARLWNAADGHEVLILKGHTSPVRCVAWSPDGTRLATGSSDGTAKVWDVAGGREWLTLKGHNGPIGSVSWSPDGTRLATRSADGTAKVWDAADGRQRLTLEGHTGLVGSVCWSPDGTRLATGSWDGLAKLWNAADGREIRTLKGHASPVRSVSWSPDGTRLATGSGDGTVKVWDEADGLELLILKGHTGMVSSVCWSPDGTRLATGGYDGTTKVWDAARGKVLLTLRGHTGLICSVSWSPDGTRLATASSDGTAKIWDAAGGKERRTLMGHTNQVRSVSWSPDGTRMLTGSSDGTAKVWEAAGGDELLTLKGHAGEVVACWSPDGRRLATASFAGTAKVWDAASARAVQQWAGRDRALQDLLDSTDFRTAQAQGFLQAWLVLVPLPFASGESSAQALQRSQLSGEASLRPRPGERVTVGGEPWMWEEYRSPKAVLDLNAVLGRVAERSVAYAVCYIESDQAREGLWLQLGSDDQAKAYLNGRQVYQVSHPRTLWTLDTAGPVGVKRGLNVLVFKVVNETGQWEGCARLVDDPGRPVQGLRAKLTP
jgi:WD40 repeat protein